MSWLSVARGWGGEAFYIYCPEGSRELSRGTENSRHVVRSEKAIKRPRQGDTSQTGLALFLNLAKTAALSLKFPANRLS